MPGEWFGDIDKLQGRAGDHTGLTDGAEDISSGVETEIANVLAFTLYVGAQGAVDVTVDLSPDGGTTWFEAPESPVTFSEAGSDITRIEYHASRIRLTGSNTTNVEATVREVV